MVVLRSSFRPQPLIETLRRAGAAVHSDDTGRNALHLVRETGEVDAWPYYLIFRSYTSDACDFGHRYYAPNPQYQRIR